MRHDHPKTWLSSESREPPCLWFMIPGMNRSADAADAFLMWVAVGAVCFFFEASIVRNVAGGQASQNHFLAVHRDGLIGIIQHRHTSGGEGGEISTVHHPLVVTEGEVGRGDGGAGAEEGENVGLRLKWRPIIFRPATIQHITCNADETWTAGAEGGKHGFWISIMQIGKKRQGRGAAWKFVGCFFRRGSPPMHPILPSAKVHSKFYRPGLVPAFFLSRWLRPPSFWPF